MSFNFDKNQILNYLFPVTSFIEQESEWLLQINRPWPGDPNNEFIIQNIIFFQVNFIDEICLPVYDSLATASQYLKPLLSGIYQLLYQLCNRDLYYFIVKECNSLYEYGLTSDILSDLCLQIFLVGWNVNIVLGIIFPILIK